MSRRLLCLLPIALLGLLAADEKNDAAEPPLEIQIEVGGQTVIVQTDKPFEVDIGGKKVLMRVTTLPYKMFDRQGIRFRYPATHAWEIDQSEPSYIMWTLDGNANVLMLTRYANAMDTDDVSRALVAELTRQYGGQRNVKVSPATMKLGAMEVTGQQLDVALANQHLRQDIYTFKAAGAVFALVIQDSLEDGKPTAETQQVVEMLEKTFEVTAQ